MMAGTSPQMEPNLDAPGDTTLDRLSMIRQRRAAITPGEWDYYPNLAGNRHWSDIRAGMTLLLAEVQNHRHRDDGTIEICTVNAEFIAHAPADVDWLIGALIAARSEAAIAEERYARLVETVPGGSETEAGDAND